MEDWVVGCSGSRRSLYRPSEMFGIGGERRRLEVKKDWTELVHLRINCDIGEERELNPIKNRNVSTFYKFRVWFEMWIDPTSLSLFSSSSHPLSPPQLQPLNPNVYPPRS